MFVCFLARVEGDRVLGRLQLHDHTGEALRERVMNVAGHSISFFENGRSVALLSKFIQLKGEHHLMSERLSQLDFFRPIRTAIEMANANKTSDLSTYEHRNRKKSFCPSSLQVISPIATNSGISLDVITNHGSSCENQFLHDRVLFPHQWVLDERMLRVRSGQVSVFPCRA